jgi:membrane protein implicated in regulation of membrane protease activity
MHGPSSAVLWVGLIGAALLILALGLFASPLFAVVLLLLVAAGAVVMAVLRRSQSMVDAPGSHQRDATTPEGKSVPPTGRSSGAPASGEG